MTEFRKRCWACDEWDHVVGSIGGRNVCKRWRCQYKIRRYLIRRLVEQWKVKRYDR
jgi:hypothetical protein